MKLEAKDLSFCYHKGNRQILNHVSLSFDSSERLGLAAPSGFGKTTFCKILAGYEKPDEGWFYWTESRFQNTKAIVRCS